MRAVAADAQAVGAIQLDCSAIPPGGTPRNHTLVLTL